ncbi:AraC family transcriptional regulator [Acinetobacter larvae]|uniref:AraC family transcriptional regulator n=1 Tax=Acinetobacter larvae TaxID=1789224 RepID=A0A1B2M2J0_9GAMM|nr:helix-turn-helix transcriptional regulator [Acinetobacter larvae]AOA59361.1 AraC family transcriptional regulator [Acinetobacter larvae]
MHYHHGHLDYPIFAFAQHYAHGCTEPFHQHDRIQLLHSLSGAIHVQTRQGIWVIPPNKGVWIPAQTEHCIKIYGQVEAHGVFIDPYARADLANHCQVVAISPLLSELINSALSIQHAVQAHSRDERLLQLILDEVRFLEQLPFQLPEAKSATLQNICLYLSQNLGQNISLEQLAQQFHLSSKTISRYFLREMQMSFGHWQRQAKLLHALTALSLNTPILTIALDLGYDSPSAFSYMFKREMGCTPSQYLKTAPTIDA